MQCSAPFQQTRVSTVYTHLVWKWCNTFYTDLNNFLVLFSVYVMCICRYQLLLLDTHYSEGYKPKDCQYATCCTKSTPPFRYYSTSIAVVEVLQESDAAVLQV